MESLNEILWEDRRELTVAIIYHPSNVIPPQILATLEDPESLLAVAEMALARTNDDPEEQERLKGALLVLLPELILRLPATEALIQ